MGASSSKQGTVIKVNHTPLPVDQAPYPGPICQYSFLNINVQMQGHMSFNFSPGQQVITSNVDAYYPSLAQNYNDGFKVAAFFKIPGSQQRTGGLFSMAVQIPYQVVYCRKIAQDQAPPPATWQLKIEKSMIYLSVLRPGILFSSFSPNREITADLSHLYQIICQNADQGGRFVCMELTGQTQSQGMGAAMQGVTPGYGIDLFFNMPLHPNPVIYSYMAVSVPIQFSYSFTSVDLVCDWMGNLAQYVNQGWRLADIFLVNDGMGVYGTSSGHQGHHGGAHHHHHHGQLGFRQTHLNSVWIFEKEKAKMEDPTPVYECTFVEYHVKVKASGFSGAHSDFNITQLCQEMGSKGWKLVCFVDTPKIVSRGFASVTMAVMLFFQRRIMRPQNVGFAPVGMPQAGIEPTAPQAGIDPPPPYPADSK